MFYNFQKLKTELLNRLKTNNNAVSNSRLGDWLNEAQDNVSQEMDPENLMREESVNTIAGTRKYATNFEFNKVVSVIDMVQDVNLIPITEGTTEFLDPKRDDTGSPLFFYVSGLDWVQTQPNNAARIRIVSSSASDTTQKVRVNGIVNDVEDSELITLNGTTDSDGSKLFTTIHNVSKDSDTTGKITVSVVDYDIAAELLDTTFVLDTSMLTAVDVRVVAEFGPKQFAAQKQSIFVWPIPTDVRELRVRGYRRPRMMVNNEDFPDLPEAYHQILLLDATVRGHNDLFRPQLAEQVRDKELKPMIAKLKSQMGNKRSKLSPVLRGQSNFTRNYGGRLPGNYPVF